MEKSQKDVERNNKEGIKTTELRYVRTHRITGSYEFNLDVIEISSYLEYYSTLHAFILNHELRHAEIFKKGFPFYKHIILDVKDSFKLDTDPSLFDQKRAYIDSTSPKGFKMWMNLFIYELANGFSSILLLFLSPFTLVWRYRKRRGRN